jgi:hypothetical protein
VRALNLALMAHGDEVTESLGQVLRKLTLLNADWLRVLDQTPVRLVTNTNGFHVHRGVVSIGLGLRVTNGSANSYLAGYDGRVQEIVANHMSRNASDLGMNPSVMVGLSASLVSPVGHPVEVRMEGAKVTGLTPCALQIDAGKASGPLHRLDWQILPPDWLDRPDRVFGPRRLRWSAEQRDRLEHLRALGPRGEYQGSAGGMREYLLFEFPGVVVADCVIEGNATYYHFCSDQSWMDVFRGTKTQARRAGAQKMVHKARWKKRISRLVELSRLGIRPARE